MGRFKWALWLAVVFCTALAIYFVLQSEQALVVHPKGQIAADELALIKTNIYLMLLIIIPTCIALFYVAWKYRSQNQTGEGSHALFPQIVLWTAPSIIVVIMSFITWEATHKLDPYRPLESNGKPLTIQVVALDWKWLFIYPEQNIATLNFVQFPENTPIAFHLSADGSPMNSFWIPSLSGQIYAMSGMVTKLHILAHHAGEYSGQAAEINGEGYADMRFIAKATSQQEFENWITKVKESPLQLNEKNYNALLTPSIKDPIKLYSYVDEGLFNKIVMKPMHAP